MQRSSTLRIPPAIRRSVAMVAVLGLVVLTQVLAASPAWACHGMSTTTPTAIPGGFTFEARATTSGGGNIGWEYTITSTTPSGLTPDVEWFMIDAYPGGDVVGSADPTTHAAGEGMRFFVTGLSAGDSVTIQVAAFTGSNGDCTGSLTSRISGTQTGTVDEDAPAPAAPAAPEPPTLACTPSPVAAGSSVTCTVTGGDPGIAILWRANTGSEIGRAGVTLDAQGAGTFSFLVPVGAMGELGVELVEWGVGMTVPVTGPAPTRVAAGAGSSDRPIALVGVLAVACAGLGVGAVRSRRSGRSGA